MFTRQNKVLGGAIVARGWDIAQTWSNLNSFERIWGPFLNLLGHNLIYMIGSRYCKKEKKKENEGFTN